MNKKTDKRAIRLEIIKRRDVLDPVQHKHCSVTAAKRLLVWLPYEQASTVLLFAGVRSEIDTRFLTEESLHQGKRIAMPRCVPSRRELLLLKINDWADLQPSFYGLLEPSPTAAPIPFSELDLVVVPGVAFSPDGYRIGYGGGYYDRLMARLVDVCSVGLAFNLQLVSRLWPEKHDRPVDFLVTEKELIDCLKIRKEREKGDTDHAG
ncbi:MAG: 5-formyltetrahydrofolate cyclo-ligase [bacterium]|jgi:5-formyltetrahydrofolate cyclo-ligase